MPSRLLRLAAALSLAALPGCATLGHHLLGLDSSASSQDNTNKTVFGYVVADEPQAALVGRQILNQGGNAADAAAATGFALAVTLPSRAALGGGGACLVRMPDAQGHLQPPVALLFPAGTPASSQGGDRPAAVPTMARGLLALQAGYGQMPQPAVVIPAERLAANAQVAPALATDLQVVGNALLADPAAAAIFAPNGTLLRAGANMHQPDLAATLDALRTLGVQGFYAGSYAQSFAAAAQSAGGGLTVQDLAAAKPRIEPAVAGSAEAYQTAELPVTTPAMEMLPASAAFMALDKNGGSVICLSSLNNLFGTGRIAPGTGVLLAASPRTNPTPDLAAAMAYTPGTFRAAASGTGQSGATNAARAGLANALAGHPDALVPEPGRANVISCPGGVPGGEGTCVAVADRRGQGLAIGGR